MVCCKGIVVCRVCGGAVVGCDDDVRSGKCGAHPLQGSLKMVPERLVNVPCIDITRIHKGTGLASVHITSMFWHL